MKTAALISTMAIALTATARAQQPIAPPVNPVLPHEVIADVRRIIAANYVLADLRPRLDAALAHGLSTGHYDVTDPGELAERINADMQAVAHDKHLGLRYDPAGQSRLALRPAGSGADDAPPAEDEIRQATKFNYGILELKVLPGNVRYIDLTAFFWGGRSAEAYDNALRFLRDGDAAIIDLRQNGGGSPEAVQYLVSHFLEPNRRIVTFYMGVNKVDHLASLASLPAGRLVGKPLYILTSGRTASAAEEFTGHVAGFRLGEVIGENTAGAGFRNEFFPVSGGYVISVSIGRAVLASTGKDWEGVGITPTTKVDAAHALEVAQIHALRHIALGATGKEKQMLESTARLLEAKLNPIATALTVEHYVGTYEGGRSVMLEGGKLSYQRLGGPKVELIPLGSNEFGISEDPLTRISFTVSTGRVTDLKMVRGDGSIVEAARSM